MFFADVNILFVNVPLRETVTISTTNLTLLITAHTSRITSFYVLKTNVLILMSSHKEVDGNAVGSTAGPIVANIFAGMTGKQLHSHIVQLTKHRHYADDDLIFTDDKY